MIIPCTQRKISECQLANGSRYLLFIAELVRRVGIIRKAHHVNTLGAMAKDGMAVDKKNMHYAELGLHRSGSIETGV
jgi:hypothetical protein